jgi:hypothetical protein
MQATLHLEVGSTGQNTKRPFRGNATMEAHLLQKYLITTRLKDTVADVAVGILVSAGHSAAGSNPACDIRSTHITLFWDVTQCSLAVDIHHTTQCYIPKDIHHHHALQGRLLLAGPASQTIFPSCNRSPVLLAILNFRVSLFLRCDYAI